MYVAGVKKFLHNNLAKLPITTTGICKYYYKKVTESQKEQQIERLP